MSQLTIGQYLKQVRVGKNISLRHASEHTKINERLLRDFEADKFEKLPNVAYLKGFLKQLSVVFEFNHEEAVELLEKTVAERNAQSNRRGEIKERLTAHDLLQDFERLSTLLKTSFSLRGILSVSLTMLFAVGLYLTGYYLTKNEPFHSVAVVTKDTSLNVSSEKKIVQESRQEINLKISGSDCWIAYKIDTQPVRNLTLGPGEKLKLEGQVIRLSLGKPESVEIRSRNSEVDIKPYITSGGTAHLIFSSTQTVKFAQPFFVFNSDGSISPRKDQQKTRRTN